MAVVCQHARGHVVRPDHCRSGRASRPLTQLASPTLSHPYCTPSHAAPAIPFLLSPFPLRSSNVVSGRCNRPSLRGLPPVSASSGVHPRTRVPSSSATINPQRRPRRGLSPQRALSLRSRARAAAPDGRAAFFRPGHERRGRFQGAGNAAPTPTHTHTRTHLPTWYSVYPTQQVFVYDLPSEFNADLKKKHPRCVGDQYGTEIRFHEQLLARIAGSPSPVQISRVSHENLTRISRVSRVSACPGEPRAHRGPRCGGALLRAAVRGVPLVPSHGGVRLHLRRAACMLLQCAAISCTHARARARSPRCMRWFIKVASPGASSAALGPALYSA